MTEASLTELKSGDTGIVSRIEGGQRMITRLSGLGITEGIEIEMVSRQPMKGPVLIKTGRTKVAIGHGMAGRIFINKG